MKQATIWTAFLVILAAPTLAQTPDTTSAWRYLALEVGNVWEYERWEDVCEPNPPFCEPEPDGFLRRSVISETTIGDMTFFVVEDAFFSEAGQPTGAREVLVRFDTTEARAYEHRLDGSLLYYWPEGFPCPLDISFGGDGEECEGYPGFVESYSIEVVGQEVEVKQFSTSFGSYAFVAGIGLIDVYLGKFSASGYDLTFARIDGVEYGPEQFPVAVEYAPLEADLALTVFPNPSHHATTVRFSLDTPQRVRLAVYDVLGRRVFADDFGVQPVGEGTHRLDLGGLPAGVYVVRLDGEAGARATARLVLQ